MTSRFVHHYKGPEMPGLRRRFLTATAALLVLGAGLPARADDPRLVGSLRAGEAVFWKGTVAQSGETGLLPKLPDLSDGEECAGDDCVEYALELLEEGHRLRVAIDTPDCTDEYLIELVDPRGQVVAEESSCYSAEVYRRQPLSGTWTIQS